MRCVSQKELLEVLDTHKGANFISAVVETTPTVNVKSRVDGTPFVVRFPSGVRRVAHGQFMLGTNYTNNVNAQRAREDHPEAGLFLPESLWKGKGAPNVVFSKLLCVHKDKPGTFYLRMRPLADSHGCPTKIFDRWEHGDGTELTEAELADLKAGYLAMPSKSKAQELEKEIPFRLYNLDNVKSVQADGETYQVVGGDTPEWGVK